jgi:hypothetical protein
MENITTQLLRTGARLLLVTSTMPDGSNGTAADNAGMVRYNAVAAAVAAKHNVTVVVAMAEYVIKCRFQSNRAQRCI